MIPDRPHVALLIETSKGFGRGLLRGIAKYVGTHEPWSLYIDERAPNDLLPTWFRRWKGDGVIVRATTPRLASEISELSIPVVHTYRQFAGSSVGVYPDSVAIAEMAAKYLLDRQFRNFAFVGVENTEWSDVRSQAFYDAVTKAGCECHVYEPLSRKKYDASWEGGQDDLAVWLKNLPKPVSIMAAHDLRCLCVLDACRRINVAVPEEVAVIGVDNDDVLCELADPPLTSVAHPFDRIGHYACALLDALMQKCPVPAEPILIPPQEIVSRRSTDVVAIDDPQMAAAMRLVRERACEGMGVDEICRQVGASRRVLERGFSKYFHCSPHELILRARLERVKNLLIETDEKLDVVAARSGFARAAYLNVVFKQRVGQTPGEFRDQALASRAGRLPASSRDVRAVWRDEDVEWRQQLAQPKLLKRRGKAASRRVVRKRTKKRMKGIA